MIKEFLKQLQSHDDADEDKISLNEILITDKNRIVYEKWISVFNVMNPMQIVEGLRVVSNSMKMSQRDEIILLAYTKFMEQNMAKMLAGLPEEHKQNIINKGKDKEAYDGTMFN